MNRQEAVSKCWELVNRDKYIEAEKLYNEQTRKHGRRIFGYWLRLTIKNGVWVQTNILE